MQPHRILIIRTDRIGDVILTTPALKALRQTFAHAHLAVMVSPSTYDIVNGNPYIDDIIIDDRQGKNKGFIGFLNLCRSIRSRDFDTAIILHTKWRYNLACFLAGVPLRVGFKNNKGGNLLTKPLKDTRPQGIKHEAQYCLDVVNVIGASSAGLSLFVPSQVQADQWAREWLKENVPEGFSLIAIHPGSSDLSRCWSVSNYAKLIDQLNNRYLVKVVLVGAENNRHIVNQIQGELKHPVIDLVGKTALTQTIALIRRTKLLISCDSGPIHIAAAVG